MDVDSRVLPGKWLVFALSTSGFIAMQAKKKVQSEILGYWLIASFSLKDSHPATDFVLHFVGCKAPYDSTQCHECRVAKMLGSEPKCVAECPAEFIMNTNKECVGKGRYSG